MFKKIIGWLHLWLGLISGIIMFIVCLTGCIWVFNEEIESLGQSWKKIPAEEKPYLAPSVLRQMAEQKYPNKKIGSIVYEKGQPARVFMYKRDEYSLSVYMNPYSGKVVHEHDYKNGFQFFDFILKGHRFLWFPWKIGRPIVNYATLTFVVILTSGLILWWPKNKSAAKQRFWFKWKDSTQWKRKNYDLHNIFGFYAMLFLLMIALTGITWGLEWFSKSVYWTVSGGESQPEWPETLSDTLKRDNALYTPATGVDHLWTVISKKHPEARQISMEWPDPEKTSATIGVYVYPDAFDGFQFDSYSFDQYTLKEIPKNYYGKYENAGRAERLERMYYGIHVGSILGLPGKVLAFMAALIGATLPVTGVYIWWGRRKKTKKTTTSKMAGSTPTSQPGAAKVKFKKPGNS